MLIITEKPDAARKISYILSGGKSTTKKSGKVSWIEFTWKGKKVYCVGLRGHIVGLDFPTKFKDWNYSSLKELIEADPRTTNQERDVIKLLKDLAPKSKELIIATDYDREGEFIGVTALDIVKKVNKPTSIQRAKYSSFTAKDINTAFNNLDSVDYDLADAAKGRQIIDLLWGAVLTRFMTLLRTNDGVLSVGRVQTPTLAKIVERELEIKAFVPEDYWQISAACRASSIEFRALHEKVNFKKEPEALRVYNIVKGAKSAKVIEVNEKKQKSYPPAPFDTTQYVKEATRLGLTAEKAMSVAEGLYMKGYISYPRTDNTHYPASLDLRAQLGIFNGGDATLQRMATKVARQTVIRPSKGKKQTQDHPPIYPTAPATKSDIPDGWRVYDLIARRFLATLYIPYEYETTTVKLDIKGEVFRSSGSVVIEEGWREFYQLGWSPPDALPKMKVGDTVVVLRTDFDKKETQPPGRYSQGSLMTLMEKLGIGTKSTRHNIIKTLAKRGYITGGRSAEATDLGINVIKALQKHAGTVTTPAMTAQLEKDMDLVADSSMAQKDLIEKSRKMLRIILGELQRNTLKIKTGLKKSTSTSLGPCPKCGETLEVRMSRKKKRFVGCSGYPKCDQTYPLPQKGKLTSENRSCTKCKAPIVKVINSKGKGKKNTPWVLCVNMGCDGK